MVVGGRFVSRAVERQNQPAVVAEDFVREFRSRIGCQDLAIGRVQCGDRRVEPERHVDSVADGDQPLRQLYRLVVARVPCDGPLLPAPVGHRAFPQQHAVEGISSDQKPLVGNTTVNTGRGFVNDVEDSTATGHHGADAGRRVVVTCPEWPGHPLQKTRRPRHTVTGHGIAVGTVKPVRPFVNGLRTGLDDPRPAVAENLVG